jgi:hypothetical protein
MAGREGSFACVPLCGAANYSARVRFANARPGNVERL